MRHSTKASDIAMVFLIVIVPPNEVIIQIFISPQIGVIYRKIAILLLVQLRLTANGISFLKYFLYQVEGLNDLRNLFVNHEVKLWLAAKMSANIAQMG
jgi:hypothetical protein